MALDFLSSPSTSSWLNPDTGQTVPISSGGFDTSSLQNILNLVGSGMQIGNTFKGYQPTAAENAQGQAMSNQGALLQSLLDPNSTIYKNVVSGQTQQLNNATQQGINNLLQQNRKAQLMGRQTFFNPERQDEAISQYLTKQSDANANTARSNALQQILAAANGYGGQATGYGGMIKNQQAAQDKNNSATSNGLSGIAQLLPLAMKVAPMLI